MSFTRLEVLILVELGRFCCCVELAVVFGVLVAVLVLLALGVLDGLEALLAVL